MAKMHLYSPPELKTITPESVLQYSVKNGIYKVYDYQVAMSTDDQNKLIGMHEYAVKTSQTNIDIKFDAEKLKNILLYQILEVSVPASAVSKIDVSKNYETAWPIAIQSVTPTGFKLKMRCDADLTEYTLLQNWKSYTSNRYGPRFLNEYALGISIFALKPNTYENSYKRPLYISRIDVYDAFPISVENPIFKQSAADDGDAWFEVSADFACSHMRVNGLT